MWLYFVARKIKLTVRAINLNFLELSVSGPTFFVTFLLYGYVEGHATLGDFSWTDPLRKESTLHTLVSAPRDSRCKMARTHGHSEPRPMKPSVSTNQEPPLRPGRPMAWQRPRGRDQWAAGPGQRSPTIWLILQNRGWAARVHSTTRGEILSKVFQQKNFG